MEYLWLLNSFSLTISTFQTLIKELQDQLEVLIKDNTDKNVRIHKLEESLLQLNEKLGNGEKQTASSEKSSGRRDSTKSKICIIL